MYYKLTKEDYTDTETDFVFKEGLNNISKNINIYNEDKWVTNNFSDKCYWLWECEPIENYKICKNKTVKAKKFILKNPICIYDSIELQKIIVKYDGDNIEFINNPSEDVMLTAIRKTPTSILNIDTNILTEAVFLEALRLGGEIILYEMKIPTEELKISVVKLDGYFIKFIKNPTEDIKLAAVKQNGLAIEFIKNPTEDIKLAAVKQNGLAIEFIENPSEDIKLAAVKQNGFAITFIKNPTEAIQLKAINQNKSAITFIKNPTKAVKLAAM
jgi:hypothetical protein